MLHNIDISLHTRMHTYTQACMHTYSNFCLLHTSTYLKRFLIVSNLLVQGDKVAKCAVKAPVLIEASPGILASLSLDEEKNQFLIDAEYVPHPGDDLYALVCSLFRLVVNPPYSVFCTNGVEDIEKIKLFWQQCVGCDGWLTALEHAQKVDYEMLKEQLDKIFYFLPRRPFEPVELARRDAQSLHSVVQTIGTERSPLSPQRRK